MKNTGAALLLLFLTTLFVPCASANPFTGKPAETRDAKTAGTVQTDGGPGILMAITITQQKIRSKMTEWIREARTQGRVAPLLWVLGAALLYGMVHSAGPGHGKALALSYIMSFRPGMVRGLVFGNVLAFSHGMSGVIMVLVVKFVFEVSVGTSLESVTRGTQIFSYSLITLLGVFLFVKAAGKIFSFSPEEPGLSSKPSLLAALAMGMIPCPGVVMSILFCISMDLTLFGVLTGIAISTGMAITLSLVVLAGILGKASIARGAAAAGAGPGRIEAGVEALSGMAVALLGGLFLLAAIR